MAKRLKPLTLEQLSKLTESEALEYIEKLKKRYTRVRSEIVKRVGSVNTQIDEVYTPSPRDVGAYFKTLYQRSKSYARTGQKDYYFENIQEIAFTPKLDTIVSYISDKRINEWVTSVLATGFKADEKVIARAVELLSDDDWNAFFNDSHYFRQVFIEYKWDNGGGELALYHNNDAYGTGLSPWVQRLNDFCENVLGITLLDE